MNLDDANDRQQLCGRRVLSESRVDPGLLATLVDDPDIWVRSELDHNHNAPPEVLTRLGADPEVAGNDVTPAGVLVGLADDPDPKVT